MNTPNTRKRERQYFIDWLRIGLIVSVFFFHVGMIFRPEHWHVNSDVSFSFLNPIMSWLHLWRMPLLFLVSGIGTYYALGRRTSWQYVKERFKRLYIPFSIGIFTLVPVQVYIEKIDNYSSLTNFYTHMFEGIYPVGNFSWHHLWFIAYLFLISIAISPFLGFTRSSRYERFRNKLVTFVSQPLGMNWVLPVMIGSQWYLRQYFPNSTHALFNDWAYIVFYLIFFLMGFVLFTSEKVIKAVAKQRKLYLGQTVIFTAVMFSMWWVIDIPGTAGKYVYGITEIIIALSCGLTAIGYAKTYFNKDHKLRGVLNEAIYPFYLLHQPVLIIVGYFVLDWSLPSGVLALLIIFLSLQLILGIYWFMIKKSDVLRFAFGMKKVTMNEQQKELALEPAVVKK